MADTSEVKTKAQEYLAAFTTARTQGGQPEDYMDAAGQDALKRMSMTNTLDCALALHTDEKTSDVMAAMLCAVLLNYDPQIQKNPALDSLRLFIGGDKEFSEAAGTAIIDTIKSLRTPVEAVVSKPLAGGLGALIKQSQEDTIRSKLKQVFDVEALKASDFYLNAEEAKKMGFIKTPIAPSQPSM